MKIIVNPWSVMLHQLLGHNQTIIVEALHGTMKPLVPNVLIHTVPRNRPV